jgi:hypothetical protein
LAAIVVIVLIIMPAAEKPTFLLGMRTGAVESCADEKYLHPLLGTEDRRKPYHFQFNTCYFNAGDAISAGGRLLGNPAFQDLQIAKNGEPAYKQEHRRAVRRYVGKETSQDMIFPRKKLGYVHAA